MKNKFAIVNVLLLTMVMLFQTIGYVIVYKVWITKNKHDVKMNILRDLPDDVLALVKIPPAQGERSAGLIMFDDGEEFQWNGDMYDVVRKEIRNDTIIYFAYHDVKESSLIHSLSAEISQQTSQDPAAQQCQMLLLSIGQLQYVTFSDTPHHLPILQLSDQHDSASLMIDPTRTIHTPPPESFLFI